ncbi:SPOR domain-containing protein [Actibacterium ureilyticum]|uniref:SPOR domain-containing protein n=1 Tax=Actibacterium ureilyticum TaxID=1590614 RepID=UPI000BAB2461|nr:SPOR domain-containing protein [Actibacterium ureilyticum]
MARTAIAGWTLAAGMTLALSGCEDIQNSKFFQKKPAADTAEAAAGTTGSGKTRDVEAPEVFEASEAGLWDGRPSLGGVWVAHPDVTDPERVIIRNESNGKTVIGALFRRERQNPGPKLQVSSDAASALELLAGAPTDLYVVALRTEEIPAAPVISPEEVADDAPTEELAAPSEIETATLDPIASAAAAIDAAEEDTSEPVITPAEDSPAPAIAAADIPDLTRQTLTVSPLEKPFIQIGIFSVEDNANSTAQALRDDGMSASVLSQKSQGKEFWRVVVGPANSTGERSSLQDKVRKLGYEDAYFVTN